MRLQVFGWCVKGDGDLVRKDGYESFVKSGGFSCVFWEKEIYF